MSVSTDGIIFYGWVFEEGTEFPWDQEEYDHDIKTWWKKLLGYEPPFEIYDERGEYLNNEKPTSEQLDEYYRHRREWFAANPLPVELVNYCSYDCPMYALVITSSLVMGYRGCPAVLDLKKLINVEKDDATITKAKQFVDKYVNSPSGDLNWYLASFWG